jgi:leukotriene-A4 hydrolase
VFLERKITGRLHGNEFAEFSAILGWKALKDSVEQFGEDKDGFTQLVTKLEGKDPDDAFSSIPYVYPNCNKPNKQEKGFNLLYEIQARVGGAEIFEPFMPAYFSNFRIKSITTDEFKNFLYKWFTEKHGESMANKLDEIDWMGWLYGRGMPPVTPKFDMTLAAPAYDLAKRWSHAASKKANPNDLDFKKSDLKGWFAGQICKLPILSVLMLRCIS